MTEAIPPPPAGTAPVGGTGAEAASSTVRIARPPVFPSNSRTDVTLPDAIDTVEEVVTDGSCAEFAFSGHVQEGTWV